MHKARQACILTLTAAALLCCNQGASASMPSDDAIRTALLSESFLRAGTEMNIAADPDHPEHKLISTFLNSSATKNDCIIDALLMGKILLDLSQGEINRVTITFFSTDNHFYRQISVRSSDVKGFGAGDVKKEELFKNVEYHEGKNAEMPSALVAFLRQSCLIKQLKVAIASNELDLSAAADLSGGDSQIKMSALRLAHNALAVAPEGIEKVVIQLSDPFKESDKKQMIFKASDIALMMAKVQNALAPLAIVNFAGAEAAAAPGPFLERRQKILAKLQADQKQYGGMKPFFTVFNVSIEGKLASADEQTLQANIKNLEDILEAKDKERVNLKNRASQLKKTEDDQKNDAPAVAFHAKKHADWRTLGDQEFMDDQARHNPDGYAERLRADYLTKQPVQPELARRFVAGLLRISDIMKEDNRLDESAKFLKWANETRAKYKI